MFKRLYFPDPKAINKEQWYVYSWRNTLSFIRVIFKSIYVKILTDPYSRLLDSNENVICCCLKFPESLKHVAVNWTLRLDFAVVPVAHSTALCSCFQLLGFYYAYKKNK